MAWSFVIRDPDVANACARTRNDMVPATIATELHYVICQHGFSRLHVQIVKM